MKNRKVRLDLTIQTLILHMFTIFEDSSSYSSGENCDTNLAVKDRKNGQIKGMIKARSPILNPTIQQLIFHLYTKFQDSSFNSSWENCARKNLTELRSYVITKLQTDQIQYSPTFSKWGYNYWVGLLLLHGPPMLVDKTNVGSAIYNHANLKLVQAPSNFYCWPSQGGFFVLVLWWF